MFHPYSIDGNGLPQGLIAQGALKIAVNFTSADKLMIAEYRDGFNTPWIIGYPGVRVNNLRLKGKYSTYLDDLTRVMEIIGNERSVIRGVESFSEQLCSLAPREKCHAVELPGEHLVESFTVGVRPKDYCNHFDFWSCLTMKEILCHPMSQAFVGDGDSIPDDLIITPTISTKNVDIVKSIGVGVAGCEFMNKICPKTYRLLEGWSRIVEGSRDDIFRRDTCEAYSFNFNTHFPSMKFSNFLNMAVEDSVQILIEFEEEFVNDIDGFVDINVTDHANQTGNGVEIFGLIHYINVLSRNGQNLYLEYKG
jgi:hypothetical protein